MRNKLDKYFDGFFTAVKTQEPVAEMRTAAQLVTEFGQYMDMQAAANPHRFHHVYEWNRVGQADARLFELNIIPTPIGTSITYELKQSSTPNDNGFVFADKATVMESGQSVTTTPEGPVPVDRGESFRVGSFTFVPGGYDTNGAFRETFMLYFTTRTNVIVKKNKVIRPHGLTYGSGYKDGASIYDNIGGQ